MVEVNEVHQSLSRALVNLRNCSEAEAWRAADELLNHDTFNRELIGVQSSGDRAIYYDRLMSSIRAIPFDQEDFDGLASRKIERVQDETEADAFVREYDAWGWLHPRYRWIVESEITVPDRASPNTG